MPKKKEKVGINHKQQGELFYDPEKARAFIEKLRWQDEPYCPHCGCIGAYKIEPKKGSSTRPGVYKCKACRKQFSVTVGTILEGSKIPLNKWLHAIYLMCTSKKGISANQLSEILEITYKSAWFLCHRIRKAMEKEPMLSKLGGMQGGDGEPKRAGEVEADETYVGGKKRGMGRGPFGSDKAIVFTLVDRQGESRSFHIPDTKAIRLQRIIRNNVSGVSHILTDEHASYRGLDRQFAGHSAVNHSDHEYVRGVVHTNFAESFFSLLKRGIFGTFHHVSKKHLQRYLDEFDFRWSNRDADTLKRMARAIKGSEGKRLMYRRPARLAEEC